jgi:hypothetical protein
MAVDSQAVVFCETREKRWLMPENAPDTVSFSIINRKLRFANPTGTLVWRALGQVQSGCNFVDARLPAHAVGRRDASMPGTTEIWLRAEDISDES